MTADGKVLKERKVSEMKEVNAFSSIEEHAIVKDSMMTFLREYDVCHSDFRTVLCLLLLILFSFLSHFISLPHSLPSPVCLLGRLR